MLFSDYNMRGKSKAVYQVDLGGSLRWMMEDGRHIDVFTVSAVGCSPRAVWSVWPTK